MSGNGSVTTPITLTGTLLDINTALASGLIATSAAGCTGKAVLTIVSNDKGSAGAGGFTDAAARGYRIPTDWQQFETLPSVNMERLKVVFSEDVGPSLSASELQISTVPGFTALGVPPGTPHEFQSVVGASS